MAVETHGETWREVEAHASKRLSRSLSMLEAKDCDPETTAYLRGQIAENRVLLALADKPKLTTESEGGGRLY